MAEAKMPAGRYIATRISTLKPPMDHAANPIRLLRQLNRKQYSFFFLGFFAWAFDAADFFCTSVALTALAKTFDKPTSSITWGIT
jgi:SHS family lactate transporter-like MFS transporter